MKCTDAWRSLDEWVEGQLAPVEARRLEEHLASCAACRKEEIELRQLLALAKALTLETEPKRDLWSGIAAGIEGRGAGWWRLSAWLGNPTPWAAATAIVLAVGLMTVTRGGGPSGDRPPTPQGSAYLALVSDEPSIADVEAEYEKASIDLLAAVEARQDRLPADTVERVRRNLEVIDRARAEVREALRTDPENPSLVRLLASTQQHKLDLLQRVVRLSS